MKITKEQMQKIRTFAREKCKNNDINHNMSHIKRTVKFARLLAKAEGADSDICEAAAWLHDIAQATHHAKHFEVGAKMAREFLETLDLDKKTIDAICHAVLCHSPKTRHLIKTKEDAVVFDADRLRAVGVYGFCKLLSHGIVHSKSEFKEASDFARKTEQKRYDVLVTKTAKKLAKDSHKLMQKFYKLFDKWDKVDFK